MPAVATQLESLIAAISQDPGLTAKTNAKKIADGVTAARLMTDVIGTTLDSFNANTDKIIRPGDVYKASGIIRADFALYGKFIVGHGDDAGTIETGFHKLQGDGGTLQFMGRNFIDTVADAVFHIGFEYANGHLLNEDGNKNESVRDVAGWLNYFINGVHMRFGGSGNDEIGSGKYSARLAAAANETFEVGAGNDKVWADAGNDIIHAGIGNDEAGGGTGNDKIYGEDGTDKLYGEAGSDRIFGGAGADRIGGGTGGDRLYGDSGNDKIWGEKGNDLIDGGSGNDEIGGGLGQNDLRGGGGNDVIYGDADKDILHGDAGNDKLNGGGANDQLYGGAGNDELNGDLGADTLNGGAGADRLCLWDSSKTRDTLVFELADSGRTAGTIDRVAGFNVAEDKIDLRAFGALKFSTLDFVGDGKASVFFDGHHLRIDTDGDRTCDMLIEFVNVEKLIAADFLLA